MSKLIAKLTLLGIATFGLTNSAHAAMIDLTMDFTAKDFITSPLNPVQTPPYSEVSGVIQFQFDNTSTIDGTTQGLTVSNFTLPESFFTEYSYNSFLDSIFFGSNVTTNGCSFGSTGFCLRINNVSTSPFVTTLTYQTAPGQSYTSFFVDADFQRNVSAVLEPATWAMFLLGFGAVGYSVRRRKATTARLAIA